METILKFSTLEYVKSLEDAGMERELARVQALAFESVLNTVRSELATKKDVEAGLLAGRKNMETGLLDMKKDMETGLLKMRKDMETGLLNMRNDMETGLLNMRKDMETGLLNMRKDMEAGLLDVRKELKQLEERMSLKIIISSGSVVLLILGSLVTLSKLGLMSPL